jgi:hypothetical protein
MHNLGTMLLLSLVFGAACSDDDSGAGPAGAGGGAGAGGNSSLAGAAGSSGSGGAAGADGGGSSYGAREACDLFAEAACNKALSCGLVLAEYLDSLVCLQCDPSSLQIISDGCVVDLAGSRPVGAVDTCLESLTAQSCEDVCLDLDPPGCEVFDALDDGGGDAGAPVICDELCVEP